MVAPDKPTLEVARVQPLVVPALQGENREGRDACRHAVAAQRAPVTKWLKPACLVKNPRVDYAPTGRAKCKGDGSPIAKGEPRVLFRILDCLGNVNSQCIFAHRTPPSTSPSSAAARA